MNIKTVMMRCGLAVCLLAQPVVAGPMEDGKAAYDRNDYATALSIWRPLAEKGDAAVQNSLGDMYYGGHGVPKDYVEAVKWSRLAAEQGLAEAQNRLAIMYLWGDGIPKDFGLAAKWYRKAAEQGYSNAQHQLGVMYEEGHGVPQDFVQAHMWFNLASANWNFDNAGTSRDLIAAKMTPGQIAEAQRLAQEWLAAHPKK